MLLGAQSLHSVKLIMTDGDSQEMSQADFAISTYFFVNAGGTWLIKAGDKIVKAWVIGE